MREMNAGDECGTNGIIMRKTLQVVLERGREDETGARRLQGRQPLHRTMQSCDTGCSHLLCSHLQLGGAEGQLVGHERVVLGVAVVDELPLPNLRTPRGIAHPEFKRELAKTKRTGERKTCPQ